MFSTHGPINPLTDRGKTFNTGVVNKTKHVLSTTLKGLRQRCEVPHEHLP